MDLFQNVPSFVPTIVEELKSNQVIESAADLTHHKVSLIFRERPDLGLQIQNRAKKWYLRCRQAGLDALRKAATRKVCPISYSIICIHD